MFRLRLAAAVAAAIVFAGGASVASADPVGEPGTPNCFGQRVSHGSSHSDVHEGHGLTPVERVEINEEFLGIDLSLKDFVEFVKFNCSEEGMPPPI